MNEEEIQDLANQAITYALKTLRIYEPSDAKGTGGKVHYLLSYMAVSAAAICAARIEPEERPLYIEDFREMVTENAEVIAKEKEKRNRK